MKSIYFIPFTIVFISIFLLSTVFASPVQVFDVGYADKINHALAYFTLSTSLMLAFQKLKGLTLYKMYLITFFCGLYGLVLEMVQFVFFDNRAFEWLDAFANVCGASLAHIIVRVLTNVK
ncbi:MAG: VanZ family protein [Bacteroidota bacterium]